MIIRCFSPHVTDHGPSRVRRRLLLAALLLTALLLVACGGAGEAGGEAAAETASEEPAAPPPLADASEGACVLKPPAEPIACTMQYDPVCGCDDVTYGNACMARGAGVPSFEPGACESDAD